MAVNAGLIFTLHGVPASHLFHHAVVPGSAFVSV